MTQTANVSLSRIAALDNIAEAYRLASQGKHDYQQVIDFERDFDANVQKLREETLAGTYRVGEYELKVIHDARKDRLIAKTKDFRDRVWQWMLCRQIIPYLSLEYYSEHSHAAIQGKGTHSALLEIVKYVGELSANGEVYALKFDIRQYFKSVNRAVLKSTVEEILGANPILLAMVRDLIDNVPDVVGNAPGCGIPIGNLFSQYAANIYLTPFDRWLESLGVRFVRYMDDVVILSNNLAELQKLLTECEWYLRRNLYLELKDNYQIFPVSKRGIDFVGYRVFSPSKILLRKDILLSLIRGCRKVFRSVSVRGEISRDELSSVMSRFGWVLYCSAVSKWRLFNAYILPVLRLAGYNKMIKVYRKLCQNKFSTHTASVQCRLTL